MTRILIVGGSGMLGHRSALAFAAAGGFDIHVSLRSRVREPFVAEGASYHEGIDLDDGSLPLARLLGELAPDVVINAVGAIKQKALALSPDRTFFLNGSLPHLLALLNPNRAGRVFHVSSDCVFQGTRGDYRESDTPDADDLYGRSKAVGEITYGRHLTLRTSIVGFEVGGHLGLVSWLFSQPAGSRLRGFRKAVYTGLTTGALSRHMVTFARDPDAPSGLWHVASEPTDKYMLLTRLNDAFDLGLTIEPDETMVIDRSLDDTRIRVRTGTTRPTWDDLITDLRRDWAAWPYEAVYQERRAAARSAS